ncbi:TetR/AcrR family transcriptional regulator [Demequina sp. NBRC 110054]|uniref:TetR/AcrR family transcriptional regulator n=1 Tax=Demequina sp. NBRC 110054 TaxID=1570343 RepID=UPI001177EF04|nr:TetR/AcrR family transcriptional regulator [Demequina sp. NBRC 110054]
MTSKTPIHARTRMPVDARRRQIAEKGAELVAQFGSYGVSMQTVADAVGLTLPGLNHHVRTREELLTLIIETYYDDFGDEQQLIAQLRAAGESDATDLLDLRACLNGAVRTNVDRPELVVLFVRLAVEAHDPAHPAHEYYAGRHQRLLSVMRALPWKLPPRFENADAFDDLLRTAFCAMDGTELQSLTDPRESISDLWARVDRVLFDGPEWEALR